MARLVTRSELARLAKVSAAAITKACKAQLAPACVGKRVDLDHSAAANYLTAKGVDPEKAARPATKGGATNQKAPTKPTKGRRATRKAPKIEAADRPRGDGKPPAEEAEDVERFLDMTLAEIVERFGTETQFKDFLVARKTIADIREKELKSDEMEGRLIERDLVKTHVFGAIEAGNRRLLGDAPKTITRRVYALAKSGAPVEEAEAVVRELISSQLRPVKATAARVLRNA